jgi:hypothetical protein
MDKLPQIKSLYKKIRNSPVHRSLRFLVFFIQNIIKDEEETVRILEAEALSHYCHALIYNVLEENILMDVSASTSASLQDTVASSLARYFHIFSQLDLSRNFFLESHQVKDICMF